MKSERRGKELTVLTVKTQRVSVILNQRTANIRDDICRSINIIATTK